MMPPELHDSPAVSTNRTPAVSPADYPADQTATRSRSEIDDAGLGGAKHCPLMR